MYGGWRIMPFKPSASRVGERVAPAAISLLDDQLASVYVDVRASDVRRLIRCEEHNERCYFVWRREDGQTDTFSTTTLAAR